MNKKNSTEFYTLACEFVHETDAAVLIIDVSTGEKLWIPLSQVEEMHKTPDDSGKLFGEIVMTAWIAKQKGLI